MFLKLLTYFCFLNGALTTENKKREISPICYIESMPKELVHAVILVVVVALAFLFPKSVLAQYDLQLYAVLFVILFAGKRFFKTGKLLDAVIFTFVILSLVNTTGGTTSPFFFLLYFLLFSVTLLLEPVVSIPITLASVIFFLLFYPEKSGLQGLLSVFSLAFLMPFSLFMGKEYERNLVLKKQQQTQQQDTFLFLSLMIKNHIKTIKQSVENFMGDHDLHEIKKSTQEMEHLIEKFEKGEDVKTEK